MTNGSLMKVESIADLTCILKAIIGLENQFSVFLRVDVLRRFYCSCTLIEWLQDLQVLIIMSVIGIWKCS